MAGVAPKSAVKTVKLVPAASGFDLLEGGYQKVRQTRVLLEVVAGISAALLIVVIGLGVRASISSSNSNSLIQTIQAETRTKINLFNQKATYSPNGTQSFTLSQLRSDVTARLPILKTITGSQIDIQRVLADVNALTATGASITNVSITPTTPSTTTATTTGTPSTPAGYVLSITASTPSPAVSNELLTRASAIGYLVKTGQPGGFGYSLGGSSTAGSVLISAMINTNPAAGPTAVMSMPSAAASIKLGGK